MEILYRELAHFYKALEIELDVPYVIDFEQIGEGATALSCCPPIIDAERLRFVLAEVVKLFIKHNTNEKATLDKIFILVNEDDEILKKRLNDLFLGKDLGDVFKANGYENPALLKLVLSYTIKPFLQAFARSMEDVFPKDQWKMGYCPICGHEPSIARLSRDENGRRYLVCIICETQWLFNRVACPHCLEKDPDKLGYFRIEGEDKLKGYKVNFCRSCKGYIKILDEREGVFLNEHFFLTDIDTSLLDYAASNQGDGSSG